MLIKSKISILCLISMLANAAQAQTPASPGISVVSPGFTPPGLSSLVTTPAVKPVPKANLDGQKNNNNAIPKATNQELPKPVEAKVEEVGSKPAVKTRAEILKAESRQFKPTGKNVIVSEASVNTNETEKVDFFKTLPTLLKPAIEHKLEAIINARPGEPVNVVIGVGVLNRIQTPLIDAVIDTINDIQIKKAGGVIMVATSSDEPISIIAREKDAPENAIMINLIPQEGVSARDVRINAVFKKSEEKMGEDGLIEKDAAHPLAVKLKNIMRDMAKGKVPSGFSLERGNGAQAHCNLPGIVTSQAQILNGASLNILVYVATNISENSNEIDERGCSGRNQLAAAVWPKLSLKKGEKTELYVIESILKEDPETSTRPSTLNKE